VFKNLVFIALFLISCASLASRARLISLQSQYQFLDTEQIFSFPTKLSELKYFVTAESGKTTPLKASEAAYAVGTASVDATTSIGVGIGRQSMLLGKQKDFFNQTTAEAFTLSQNPVHLLWSTKKDGESFALKFFNSSYRNKVTEESENSLTVGAGARIFSYMSLAFDYGLFSRTVLAGNKVLHINHAMSGNLMYEADGLSLFLKAEAFQGRQANAGTEVNSIDYQQFDLEFLDTTNVNEYLFFYQLGIIVSQLKNNFTGVRQRINQLPITLGIESRIKEWLKLRASIKQTAFLNKAEEISAAENETQAAVGLGILYDRLTIDGVMTGLTGQNANAQFSANDFLSQVSLTYFY